MQITSLHTPTTSSAAAVPRIQNRQLSQDRVLELMARWMPRQRQQLSIVGTWLWLSFRQAPGEQVIRELRQLGWKWNPRRQLWQHSCGQLPAVSGKGVAL